MTQQLVLLFLFAIIFGVGDIWYVSCGTSGHVLICHYSSVIVFVISLFLVGVGGAFILVGFCVCFLGCYSSLSFVITNYSNIIRFQRS